MHNTDIEGDMRLMKKRVACFYRVSSKQQVIDDDIPVQRNACLEYLSKNSSWEFYGEYVEKGVSGFKIKAKDREKLEELKEDAIDNKFDVLLVFMFDRLGRIEEETPFVLKWFVDQGIEVWSVNEGQRKFDTHVDNLLNYITFWQASGESKKIQIRTLEAKKQMVEEGKFLGCAAPYGYKHIITGETNEKGRSIKKLVVDEIEAETVKLIFNLATKKGYGSRRIAKALNEKNIPTKKGKLWAGQTVGNILKNPIYMGYFAYGRNKAYNGKRVYKHQYECHKSEEKNNDLAIVSEEQWYETKKIIESRMGKNEANIPKQTKSPLLFTGYIYCKECGSRLTLHYSYNHYRRKDGTVNRDKKAFYECSGKASGKIKCSSKMYSSARIEGFVMRQVYSRLDKLSQMDIDTELLKGQREKIKKIEKEIKIIKRNIKNLENDIKLLKGEIINVIKGTSKFTETLLSEQIEEKTIQLDKQLQDLNEHNDMIEKLKLSKDELLKFKEEIPRYREILESTDTEAKKMLLSKFVERIDVSSDDINTDLNIKVEELLCLFN